MAAAVAMATEGGAGGDDLILSSAGGPDDVPMAGSELPTVLCCTCSIAIKPNPTNMCVQCIRVTANITEGIATSLTMYQCRGCLRWLRPPWVACELESRELMALCLRKVVGLKKAGVKLVDASWIWTEPHSKRLKLKLTVQKEVVNGAILQQAFIVEFVVRNQQCDACQESFCNQTWKAVVQVRQRVDHKRTFYYLEQLILKHNAHSHCISVQSFKDGMDFFYAERNQAVRFLNFLESFIPISCKQSKKLISADNHSNTANFHFTYLVMIVPVCKDDLVLLPPSLATNLGSIPRMCLVQRVNSSVSILDPLSAQTAEINAEKYWQKSFGALMSSPRLVKYIVLGTEPIHKEKGAAASSRAFQRKARLAEVEVAKESDMGVNDKRSTAITHLGHLLNAGDTVLGYDISTANVPGDMLKGFKGELPEVVLVRKVYSVRKWQLQGLEKDKEEQLSRKDADAAEADYERFMQQLESDKEMRGQVAMYKVDSKKGGRQQPGGAGGRHKKEDKVVEEEDDAQEAEKDTEAVAVDELLDDLTLDDVSAEPDYAGRVFAAGTAPAGQLDLAALSLGGDDSKQEEEEDPDL